MILHVQINQRWIITKLRLKLHFWVANHYKYVRNRLTWETYSTSGALARCANSSSINPKKSYDYCVYLRQLIIWKRSHKRNFVIFDFHLILTTRIAPQNFSHVLLNILYKVLTLWESYHPHMRNIFIIV